MNKARQGDGMGDEVATLACFLAVLAEITH